MRVNRAEYDGFAEIAMRLLVEAVNEGVLYYETRHEGFGEPLVPVDFVIGPLDDNMNIEVHVGGKVLTKHLVEFGRRVVISSALSK